MTSTMFANDIKNALRKEIMRIIDVLPYAKVRAMIEDFNKNVNCNINSVDDVIDELFKDNKLFIFLESIHAILNNNKDNFFVKPDSIAELITTQTKNDSEENKGDISAKEYRRREIMRYRQYASATSKPGWIRVEVIESEAGFGQKIDEVLYFPNKVYADGFRDAFNSDNTETTTPNWYMVAI